MSVVQLIKQIMTQKLLIDHDHVKQITTSEFIEVFDARLKQADLVTRTDFDDKR